MAGKVAFRLTPETRKLFPEHEYFYASILDLYHRKQSPLVLKARDPEARTEVEVLGNGDVEVTLVIPLDDDDRVEDGRLYVKDKFTFDPTHKVLKSYRRDFESNDQGDSAVWLARLGKYQELLQKRPKINDSEVQSFGLAVARSYGLPFVDGSEQTLPKFKAAFQREHRYLDSLDAKVRQAGEKQGIEGLRLRIKDKENHYQVFRHPEGRVELLLNLAIDRDGAGENGRIWLKERFEFRDAKLSSFSREWAVDPRSELKAGAAAVLASLKEEGFSDREETRAFAESLYPELVPQAAPDPQSLRPLLIAGVQPAGESVFKTRKNIGPEALPIQNQILEVALNLASEDLAKRADEAEGLLSFQGKVELRSEGSDLASLFEKLKSAAEKSPGESLDRLLTGLDLNPGEAVQRQGLQEFPAIQELMALGQEKNSNLRERELLRIAETLLEKGYAGSALLISDGLKGNAKLRPRASRLSDLAQGKGDFGYRAEASFRHLHQEWTKPSMLVGMMAAPLGGVAVEAGILRGARWLYDIGKIQRMGNSVKLGASAFGMLGEAAAFTAVHRTYERMGHGSATAWHGAGNEILSSLLLFGAMRATHAGGTWASSRMAEGKFNFSLGGRDFRFGNRLGTELHSSGFAVTTPTGRLLLGNPWVPAATVGTPSLSALGNFSSALIQHLGGIGAMRVASWASQQFGMAPMGSQGSGNIFDSLLSYVQAIFGFKLANKATMGRLQPALGEAKMRTGAFEQPVPTPVNPQARHGLYAPVLPDLRLFDLHIGNSPIDFQLRPGREVALDPLLFSQNSQLVMLGLDQGGYYLIDRRPRVDASTYAMPHHFARIMNLADQALLFNRAPLPNHHRTPLAEGDSIRLGFHHLTLFQPRTSPLFAELASLPPERQLKLGAKIDAANGIDALTDALNSERPAAAAYVRDVWEGRKLLHSLPTELGLMGKVESLIQAELRRGEREGLDEMAVSMQSTFFNSRWSPLEKSLHINRAIEKLHADLQRATSVFEAGNIVQQSPFSQIEHRAIRDIKLQMNEAASQQRGLVQDLPYTAGIRQRVRDILERDNYWASMRLRNDGGPPQASDPTMQPEYNAIHTELMNLYHKVRTSTDLRREAPDYSVPRLEELLYQVLERGQPLEILPGAGGLRGSVRMYQHEVVRQAERLFPAEMSWKTDPWTGEHISSTNREAKYRLATHVLNAGARRPVLGIPSQVERGELERLVTKYLDPRIGGNFLKAQEVLRNHLDNATPEAQKLLSKAKPKEKATLLSLYFGPFRRRDLFPSTAFQVATWMGQAGMFREVGVTYEILHDSLRSTLSLGNLGNVEAQSRDDFFTLHTHPEGYKNPDGADMGFENRGIMQTMNLDQASISRSTLNILPSQIDIRLFHEKSREYWRQGNPQKFGDTPLFELQGNRFKNWVVHSLGLSKVDVVLGSNGVPQGIEVRFAARRLARLLNSEYQKQKATLEAMSAELGLPVTVTEASYDDLMSEMPYGVHSLFDAKP